MHLLPAECCMKNRLPQGTSRFAGRPVCVGTHITAPHALVHQSAAAWLSAAVAMASSAIVTRPAPEAAPLVENGPGAHRHVAVSLSSTTQRSVRAWSFHERLHVAWPVPYGCLQGMLPG